MSEVPQPLFICEAHFDEGWPAAPFWLLFEDGSQQWLGCFTRFVDLINWAALMREAHARVKVLRIYEDGKILLSDQCAQEMDAVIHNVRESLRKFSEKP